MVAFSDTWDIISSAYIRRMTFKALTKDSYLNLYYSINAIKNNAIKNTLYKRGYYRRLARYKPPIFEKNRILRLEFAYKYLH
jgi:hypothetical protein